MRAPPAGASPTRHFPPVERTTASAIASPSPAPSPPSVPGRNLSNRKGRCSTGIPGPLSSKARLAKWPLALTSTRTDPPAPAYLQALSSRTPHSRSTKAGCAPMQRCSGAVRDRRKLDVFRLGDRREPEHARLGQGD